MATRSYTIVSYYTPPKGADAVDSADSRDDSEEQEKIWQTGPLYKSRIVDGTFVSYRSAHPPRFVPALSGSEGVSNSSDGIASSAATVVKPKGSEISTWYRSIRSTPCASEHMSSTKSFLTTPEVQLTSIPQSPRAQLLPIPSTSHSSSFISKKRKRDKIPSQHWFIQGVLNTATLSSSSLSQNLRLRPSSTADILAREPPPLPGSSEPHFVPPVRTKLGPGNKGYALLARGGWREGEGLGAWRRPRDEQAPQASSRSTITSGHSLDLSQDIAVGHVYHRVISHSPNLEISEVIRDPAEIIDLTLSSGESSDESDFLEETEASPSDLPGKQIIMPDPDSGRTILVAPLKTYLKADKLGIGAVQRPSARNTTSDRSSSSAKSQSHVRSRPVKQKPFTDTAQAMYNSKETRRKKHEDAYLAEMRRLRGGKKGAKGFAGVRKEEERRRQDMLAYMNS